jgi:hypothetical protein
LKEQQVKALSQNAEINLQARIRAAAEEQAVIQKRLEAYQQKVATSKEIIQKLQAEKLKNIHKFQQDFERKRMQIMQKTSEESAELVKRRKELEENERQLEERMSQKMMLESDKKAWEFELKRLQDERVNRNLERIQRQQLHKEASIRKRIEEETLRAETMKEMHRAAQMQIEKHQIKNFLSKEEWRAKIAMLNHNTVKEQQPTPFNASE